MRVAGVYAAPGAFGENLIVSRLSMVALRVGDMVRVLGGPLLCVTQIGKTCHNDNCVIKRQAGYCIMPSRGVFVRVVRGGVVHKGQRLQRIRP